MTVSQTIVKKRKRKVARLTEEETGDTGGGGAAPAPAPAADTTGPTVTNVVF